MAHPSEVRDEVRGNYVYKRLPLAEAANLADVSYNTAREWKKKAKTQGDDWDRARSAARMASGPLGDITAQVMEDFVLLFQATVSALKNDKTLDPIKCTEALSRLADAYTKVVRAAGGSDPKMAELAIAIRVTDELAKFIRDRFPDKLPIFAQILEPFGGHLSEVFG
ncbi:MAG TPA: DUF1804 family protein [Acidiferrobacteraceae bacterium]|nr:DUF1804 family protein [Acidiferrobacteraceae bacterium]